MSTRDTTHLHETAVSGEESLVLYCEWIDVPQVMRASTWGSAGVESFADDGPREERTILLSLERAGVCLDMYS